MNTIPASRFKRFLAAIMDAFISVLFVSGLTIVTILITMDIPYLASFIIPTLYSFLYFSLFESSKYKATPGKMLFRLYVSTTTGQKLSFSHAAMRWLLYTAPSLPFVLAVGNRDITSFDYDSLYSLMPKNIILSLVNISMLMIWYVPIFFTNKRQCTYEILTSTMVCRKT